jgi:hypothetical protein
MATSVKHAVQERGLTNLETVLVCLVILIAVALVLCLRYLRVKPIPLGSRTSASALPSGCPVNAAPSDTAQLRACLTSLQFDTVAAAGDEQRLLVREALPGTPCHGDPTHSCRHGPLAKIEPVIGAHERDTSELNEGRIIARLFLRPGETEPYPKLGLVANDTTYWWIQRQSATTAHSQYVRISGDTVAATSQQTIAIELHPEGTFQQALARFLWDDTDEITQGPCARGCCK